MPTPLPYWTPRSRTNSVTQDGPGAGHERLHRVVRGGTDVQCGDIDPPFAVAAPPRAGLQFFVVLALFTSRDGGCTRVWALAHFPWRAD